MRSTEYTAELDRLLGDPIIHAMRAELGLELPADVDSSRFMLAALREYHKRGGRNAHSIGGPGRAIAHLYPAIRKEQ
jgi:hypothetical protein